MVACASVVSGPSLVLRAALVSVLVACSGGDDAAPSGSVELDPARRARLEEAMADVQNAPWRVRDNVLALCEKWRHIDRECNPDEVRVAQLECWLSDGKQELGYALNMRIRERARDLKVLRKQNLCMEMQRWRKLKPGPDF